MSHFSKFLYMVHYVNRPTIKAPADARDNIKEYVYITYALMLMAHSGAPLCLVGSLHMVLLNFWIPMGLMLTSHVILLTSL